MQALLGMEQTAIEILKVQTLGGLQVIYGTRQIFAWKEKENQGPWPYIEAKTCVKPILS